MVYVGWVSRPVCARGISVTFVILSPEEATPPSGDGSYIARRPDATSFLKAAH